MSQIESAVLVIIDGWGIRADREWNAIAQAETPHYDRLMRNYPNTQLEASGLKVGLPAGVMGNSEVGHMNIGAGRRVVQDQVRINESIENGSFIENQVLNKELEIAKKKGSRIHLMGLVSQGNVHSTERHYVSLLELISRQGFPKDKVFVHAFLDGRDTSPKSARGYLRTLEEALRKFGGRVASVAGRFYAMDRDKRWERIDLAYQAMTLGKGEQATDALDALHRAYTRGETDEFVLPTVILPRATIEPGDSVICFNFRPDRMRQMVRALSQMDAPILSLRKDLKIAPVTFTQYDKTFPFTIVFPPREIEMCLGEVVSRAGKKQYRVAETEKYAHVTYFLNGGRELPFEGEERLMIPSPKVKTYDQKPEMSSREVLRAVTDRIAKRSDALIVVNFAHPDMVGHTGNWDAAIVAVESTDQCIGAIVEAGLDHSFNIFITADHGNVEMMKDPVTGEPHTAHTTNPVPFIAIGSQLEVRKLNSAGALCDVAPTFLSSVGFNSPNPMTGKDLFHP